MGIGFVGSVLLHMSLVGALLWTSSVRVPDVPEEVVFIEIVNEPVVVEEPVEKSVEQAALPRRDAAAINPEPIQEDPPQEAEAEKVEPEPIREPEPAPEPEPVPEPIPEPEQVDEVTNLAALQPLEAEEPAVIEPKLVEKVAEPPKPAPKAAIKRPKMRPMRAKQEPKLAEKPEPESELEAKPEPEKPEAKQVDLAALLKSVENLDKRERGDVAVESDGQKKTDSLVSSVTDAELQRAIREQVGRCWSIPAGLDAGGDVRPALAIVFERDGRARSVSVIDQDRLGRDPLFRTIAESAQRAVLRCKLELPEDEFNRWQRVTMNFHPGMGN